MRRMRIVKDFIDDKEVNQIVTEMKSIAKLTEIQNHFDGNHLVFELPDRDLATEIDVLKARIEKLEGNV